jgi:hypothetical protein
MTLQITTPSNDDTIDKSENDEYLLPVSYQEPFQHPSLPYVQLCVFKNDNDADSEAFDQRLVFPVVLQRNDFAETIDEYSPPLHLSLDDEASIENKNVDLLLASNGLSDQYRTIYEIMEHFTASSSASSSDSSSEEEQKLGPDWCSSIGEAHSTTSTADFWWNFDTVDWPPNFQHVRDKISPRDRDAENSTMWFFDVPSTDDFGTNVVLLDQSRDFDYPCDKKIYTDATCGQWLQRILILPQKQGFKRIRLHESSSPCAVHPPPTNLPRRSYVVLR